MEGGPVGLGLETSFFRTGGRGAGAAGAGAGAAAAGSGEEEEVVGAARSLDPRNDDDFFLNMLGLIHALLGSSEQAASVMLVGVYVCVNLHVLAEKGWLLLLRLRKLIPAPKGLPGVMERGRKEDAPQCGA